MSKKSKEAREAREIAAFESDLGDPIEDPTAERPLDEPRPAESIVNDAKANAAFLRRSAQARLGGYKAALNMTADQRSERARKAGTASAAKRRAEREARGEVVAPSERYGVVRQPTAAELSDYFEEFDRLNPGESYSYEERRRGALLLMKRDTAERELRRASGASE